MADNSGKFLRITQISQDAKKAKALPIPFGDALHVAIAMRAGVSCIVTNNLKDFFEVYDLLPSMPPNQL